MSLTTRLLITILWINKGGYTPQTNSFLIAFTKALYKVVQLAIHCYI